MDKKFQDFENSIKTNHSINFTPKYQEEFSINIKPRIFVEIAKKTFESLGWDIIFLDENQIEANRKGDFDNWTHKITVKVNQIGKVEVKSESLGNEMWDMGKNSKRVKLFIYAFNELLKEYDETKLTELEKEVEKKDNWDDYEIPETLPLPKKYLKPQILIPIIGIGAVATVLAYLIAFLTVEGLYVIGLFEVVAGIIIGFSMKELMRLGNYINWSKIKFVLIGAVVLTFIMDQIFQYQLILSRNYFVHIDFLTFMKLRLDQGLRIKDIDVGSIGLVISWVVQLGLTYVIGYLRTISAIAKISIDRVPPEVIDFAMYHFVKGKNEFSVKQELSKMGWTSDLEQEMVLDAIGGVHIGLNLNRG